MIVWGSDVWQQLSGCQHLRVQTRQVCLGCLHIFFNCHIKCSQYVTDTVLPALMSALDSFVQAENLSCDDKLHLSNILGALVLLAPLPSFWPRAVSQLMCRAFVDNANEGYVGAVLWCWRVDAQYTIIDKVRPRISSDNAGAQIM